MAISHLSGSINIDNFELSNGKSVPLSLAYSIEGNPKGRNFVLLHGISGSHFAFGSQKLLASDGGWASSWIGPNCILDTNKDRVITFNIPGSSYGSIWHGHSEVFATISSMAQSLIAGLDYLNIGHLDGLIGFSFGGYVGLQMKALAEKKIRKLLILSSSNQGRGSSNDLDKLKGLDTPEKRYKYRYKSLLQMGLLEWLQEHSHEEGEIYLKGIRQWSNEFDASSIWRLRAAAMRFHLLDIPRDSTIFCSSTDQLFPPTKQIKGFYSSIVIPTKYGHQSLLMEPEKWTSSIKKWIS